MKKLNKTPLALAMGSAVISAFAVPVNAEVNPFAISELSSGYMAAADALNNKVSESGCGGNTGTDHSTHKPAAAATKDKKTEGSCGEGMCGAMMNSGKMKSGMEHSCGAMMKGKDGACGMGGDMKNMNHGNADHKDHSSKTTESSCGAMMGGEMNGMNHGSDANATKNHPAKAAEASCGGAMHKDGQGSCGAQHKPAGK